MYIHTHYIKLHISRSGLLIPFFLWLLLPLSTWDANPNHPVVVLAWSFGTSASWTPVVQLLLVPPSASWALPGQNTSTEEAALAMVESAACFF